MTKAEPEMRVLKTATCPTLSGKSKLTYQIGISPDSVVHLRISKNSGGGFFSDEWLSIDSIIETLKKRPKGSPVLSHFLTPLLKGKSVNTSAFILAVLSHLRLIRPLPKKKRQHELLDPMPFLDTVTQLMDSEGKTGGTSRKASSASTKKAAVRKAAIKKKAMSRRRTAKTV
jgi:hypothetical protein